MIFQTININRQTSAGAPPSAPILPSTEGNRLPMQIAKYETLTLAMFSGKGGVGKTTLSCGFARHWAHRFPDETILLLSTDPAHSLGDVLQVAVGDQPQPLPDRPNLHVQALDAEALLQTFRDEHGDILELLVERGSFAEQDDLSTVWDMGWPGLDELMGILEIQRILREQEADRVVVDMAPSGHTLNLFGLMDFLDEFLHALELFQEKHRVISQTFTGRYSEDAADEFLVSMKQDLVNGRQMLQDQEHTACLVVAIAEPMSLLETERFLNALSALDIPFGGLFVNRIVKTTDDWQNLPAGLIDHLLEQGKLLNQFFHLSGPQPVFAVPLQTAEPVGDLALDRLIAEIHLAEPKDLELAVPEVPTPAPVPPGFPDFITQARRLIIVGGKGGVGKTTVAAAIAWQMAATHPDQSVRVISIDPAHSLGDALGQPLGHTATALTPNLTGQEVDADAVLTQFREDYLWELAEMMSGDTNVGQGPIQLAYGPEAWRKIVSQSLPGIDEMLSLVTIMELLESGEESLIVLDTAPTGHLLRFLAMPTALSDWLAWIFKLWIKYQDVLGRTEFMGRLRKLRQRVVQAQKKLKDAEHTEFIGVVQAESAILAEAQRLSASLTDMGIAQKFVVQNRYEADRDLPPDSFPDQQIVRLPRLPRSLPARDQIALAAQLLFPD